MKRVLTLYGCKIQAWRAKEETTPINIEKGFGILAFLYLKFQND